MCNETRRRIALGQVREDWGQTRVPLRFPEGLPNLAPLDSIRITDPNAIIRAHNPSPPSQGGAGGGSERSEVWSGEAELIVRRWSWPGPNGKPVYNYRSEGRDLARGRCLIVADGFYEFTAPELRPSLSREGTGVGQQRPGLDAPDDAAAPPEQGSLTLATHPQPPPLKGRGRQLKDKWLFTKAGEDWFCIAGLWRATADVGEAYTLLTTEPGPDVAPYHSRQIVILERSDWVRWLDPAAPAAELLKPAAAGHLRVERVPPAQ